MAVTSSIATSVSQKYNTHHSDLTSTDPQVLLAGFRAAGWTCCGSLLISLAIAVVGMRGIGLVGQHTPVEKPGSELELNVMENGWQGAGLSQNAGGPSPGGGSGVLVGGEFEFGSSSKTGTAIPSEKSSIKSATT